MNTLMLTLAIMTTGIRDLVVDHAQPYIITIVTAVIGLVATLLLGLLKTLKAKLDIWLDAKLSVEQRNLLHKIGKEAFTHAETVYKYADGEKKLDQAYTYATSRLASLGIKMSEQEIKAAIHEAWLSFQPEPPRLD